VSRERPILFSGPMVRAIIAGRKTQTRRVVRGMPHDAVNVRLVGEDLKFGEYSGPEAQPGRYGRVPCPYGQPGDRLWVRETWAKPTDARSTKFADVVLYAADFTDRWRGHAHFDGNWRPSIHMPRKASRITLEITGVRVERLQDISGDDAKAEGLRCWTKDGTVYKWGLAERHVSGELDPVVPWSEMPRTHIRAWAAAWDSINGTRAPWDSNPWVWVIEFKEVPRATRPD